MAFPSSWCSESGTQTQDRKQPPQLPPVLRTGHTQQCPCGTGSQTTQHLQQSCPLYEPLRKGIWPDHTPVAHKLYGSLGDLRRTATFIRETGVSDERDEEEKNLEDWQPVVVRVWDVYRVGFPYPEVFTGEISSTGRNGQHVLLRLTAWSHRHRRRGEGGGGGRGLR